MAGLRPPHVTAGLVPVVTATELALLEHPQVWRTQLWLGVGSRGPLTASGIYQAVSRRGRQCGVEAWPHRFRHHFSHTWLERGGPEGDRPIGAEWLVLPADARPLRRQRPQRPRPPHLRPHHDRQPITRQERATHRHHPAQSPAA
jgi:hypothetical protein